MAYNGTFSTKVERTSTLWGIGNLLGFPQMPGGLINVGDLLCGFISDINLYLRSQASPKMLLLSDVFTFGVVKD